MDGAREFRQLLAADAALMLGLAEAPDVAAALQRYWARRDQPGVTLEAELAHIARLTPETLGRIRAEVERLVGEAGGDARVALTRRGGLDRSIHLALARGGEHLTRELSVLGIPIRAPLRALSPERYVGFETAGVGGMGVVYAAVDTELNRRVAFKMVRPHAEHARDEQAPSSPLEANKPGKDTPESEVFEQLKARLVQEAWVTGGLEHPGIVPVYEIGQTQAGIPYYTMRYVRGERTLADAIREKKGAPLEERLALLEPFLKVCDTLRYAHDRGVVHRDLKPANVALGQYGEVVLLDWGLARLEGREDVASSAWQERVAEMREDADFHTMEGGAMGTAGYMSPEATLGRLAEVDQRSDVYSLGAMLFELLTGRLPFEFRSFEEYASLLLREDPPTAREVDPSVPAALSALSARALARERPERPTSAQELADAVRAWQTENALDREVEALLRDAHSAIEGAALVEGEARLVQVDRATAALTQVETKRPRAADLSPLRRRAETLREEGIGQRERAATRRLLRRVGVWGLAIAAVVAFVVTTVIERKRKEAEDARAETQAALVEVGRERDRANEERDAKTRALEDVLRLADSKKVADLLGEVRRLWPLQPERGEAMQGWIDRARRVLANRDKHAERLRRIRAGALLYTAEASAKDHEEDAKQIEAAKKRMEELEAERSKVEGEGAEARNKALDEEAASLRSRVASLEAGLQDRRTWSFADPNVDWQHQVVVDLLAGLDRLDGGGSGGSALADVMRRREFVAVLRKASIDDQAEAWKAASDAIASSPKYGALRIAPQLGLVPLGADPDSGLYEFAHLGSGPIPVRDATKKRLVLPDDGCAIVLVLIPGGTFRMGAQSADANEPNYDPRAATDEASVHEVTLSPFFLAKHECTQAQWNAMTEGMDPSTFKAGGNYGDTAVTHRNPVEQVSCEDCDVWLGRNRLALPTEAQWEYACRAGTDTPWITGRDVSALAQVANVADAYLKGHGGETITVTPELSDGYSVHAPVGAFAANAFGLHDVHGNVLEWCRDVYRGAHAPDAATDPHVEGSGLRVCRGGSWSAVAGRARSSSRLWFATAFRAHDLGVRPARPLLP
jgi:formylglycine-generating enzyme required for sulfatase activity/serine/threonine protein kinase